MNLQSPNKITILLAVGRKALPIVLVAALVLPSFFFVPDLIWKTKRAEAQTACIGGLVMAGIGAVLGLVGLAAVPAQDSANLVQNTGTSFATGGSFVKDCILKPILDQMVKNLIRQFTVDIVNWINGGFEGSPRFMTNPEGFFGDVGDQVAGQLIYGLGPVGQVLCSPFDLRLRMALGLHYTYNYLFRYQVACRLSDIERNIDRFLAGALPSGEDYWRHWLAVTTVPQNNPYGAFINTTAAIDAQIVGARTIQLRKADWGRGFLDFEKCDLSEEGSLAKLFAEKAKKGDPQSEETYYAELEYQKYRKRECKTVTPGAVIEGQLNHALGSDLRRYEIAESIDAILGALINQMIGQAFSAVGLFGSARRSANSSGYYTSYLQRLARGELDPGLRTDTNQTFETNRNTAIGEFNTENQNQQQQLANQIALQQQAVQQSKIIQLFGAVASQTCTQSRDDSQGPAGLAIDGSDFSFSSTACGSAPWRWEVTLLTSEYLSHVTVQTHSSKYPLLHGELTLTKSGGTPVNSSLGSGEFADVSPKPVALVKKVKIESEEWLLLREVKLFRYLRPVVKILEVAKTIPAGTTLNLLDGVTVTNFNTDPASELPKETAVTIKDQAGALVSDFASWTRPPGTYTLTYVASDDNTTPSIESGAVTRTITVQQPPPQSGQIQP